MSSGKFTLDKTQKIITLEPGNTHTEQEITYKEGDTVRITLESPDGNQTFDLPDPGAYVLNLKKDTLTGGLVKYGEGERKKSLTSEEFNKMIDSTRRLIYGMNVSDSTKNYFIEPFSIKRISESNTVKVVGPYKGIPYSIEKDKSTGELPEIYKFFTNKQQRESLIALIKRVTGRS